MHQLSLPAPVEPHEIAREKSLGGAIDLCMKVGGVEPKQLAADLRMDKAQLSRWISGHEGVIWPKLELVMDRCGNEAPLMWMLQRRRFDLSSLRRTETETERQNRLLREENAALKRVLQGQSAA